MGERVKGWARGGLLLIVGTAMSVAAAGQAVEREGDGTRRKTLDAMELQDPPGGLWSALSNWTLDGKSAESLDAAKIAGKPVLVLTWASWSKPSIREALPLAGKLASEHADLVVVAAHGAQGWDAAPGAAAGLKVLVAQDAKGEFRKLLGSDSDPDFYVIDRAGHIRYADIATPAVAGVVDEVMHETKEQAADTSAIKAKRSGGLAIGGSVSITDLDADKLPLVPPGYRQPSEEDYNKADWPKITENSGEFKFEELNGELVYPTLALVPKQIVKTGREAPQGRATVVYLWHPEVPASFEVMDRMDILQRQHLRDLNVMGAAITLTKIDNNRANNMGEDKDIERLTKGFADFVKKRNSQHTLVLDTDVSSLASLGSNGSNITNFPVPGAIVASSDGTIRWAGPVNSPAFRSAVDKVVRNDPGIRNRRMADREFLLQSKK